MRKFGFTLQLLFYCLLHHVTPLTACVFSSLSDQRSGCEDAACLSHSEFFELGFPQPARSPPQPTEPTFTHSACQ